LFFQKHFVYIFDHFATAAQATTAASYEVYFILAPNLFYIFTSYDNHSNFRILSIIFYDI